MKTFLSISKKLILSIFFLSTLFSCDVKKRIYRNGFYIEIFSLKSKTNKKEISENKNSPEVLPSALAEIQRTKDINSSKENDYELFQLPQNNHCTKKQIAPTDTGQKKGSVFKATKETTTGDTIRKEVDYFELQKVKTRSVMGFVFSVMSLPLIFYGFGVLLAILGIIFSVSALIKAKKIPYPVKRIKFAKLGLIFGIIGLVLGTVGLIFVLKTTGAIGLFSGPS